MQVLCTILLAAWATLSAAQLVQCNSTCQLQQRNGLIAAFTALGGPKWTVAEQGWLQYYQNPNGSWPVNVHCSWAGIYCCSNQSLQGCAVQGGVYVVYLGSFGLAGQIPDGALAPLVPSLQIISWEDNNLTGSLPVEFNTVWPLMAFMTLRNNSLSGTLPDRLFEWPLLRTVDLGRNQFTGSLPALSGLTRCEELSLDNNQLTQTVPADWWQMPALQVLDLAFNNLSGTIPAPPDPNSAFEQRMMAIENGQSRRIRLHLHNNKLTGSIPSGLASLALSHILVFSNQLTGTLPAVLMRMPYLTQLFAHHNMLTGTISNDTLLPALSVLHLGSNNLTGTLPPSLTYSSGLQQLILTDNNMSGPLPPGLGGAKVLLLLNIRGSGMQQVTRNRYGQRLPPFMYSDMTVPKVFQRTAGDSGVLCPPWDVNYTLMPRLRYARIDAQYVGYDQCQCATGFVTHWTDANHLKCTPVKVPFLAKRESWYKLVLPFLVGVLLAMAAASFWLRWRLPSESATALQLKLQAANKQQITLVLTDAEAWKELFQWNPSVMATTASVYSKVMSSLQDRYKAIHLHEEGDAVLLAFLDPVDAVCWCLATQKALVSAQWPVQLQMHKKTRTLTLSTLLKVSTAAAASRATASTSRVESAKSLEIETPRTPGKKTVVWEQQSLDAPGEVDNKELASLQGIVAPHEDYSVFKGVRVRMCIHTGAVQRSRDPAVKVLDRYSAIIDQLKGLIATMHGGQVLCSSATFAQVNSRLTDIAAALPQGQHNAADSAAVSAQNSELPSRSTSAASRWSSFGEKAERSMSAFFEKLWHPHTGGQLTSRAHSQDDPARDPQSARGGVMVMDMGLHVVPGLPEPQQLQQILPPGLEERARHVPPLRTTRQLMPGYFDAPGAGVATLTDQLRANQPAEPVTLVFTAIQQWHEMKTENAAVAEVALTLFRDCLRRCLRLQRGYECQEAEGSFMLAFTDPIDAVKFCVLVQEDLLEVSWGSAVLALEPCRTVLAGKNEVVLRGPRVKLGVYIGRPTKVTPHTTTGRADYFGPFVNRAARYGISAAHGGQICTSAEVIQAILKTWAPDVNLSLPSQLLAEPIQIRAQYLRHLMHRQRIIRNMLPMPAPNFGSPDRTLSRPSGLFTSSELGRQLARRLSNQLRRIMSVRSTQDQEVGDEENGGRVRDYSPRTTADEAVAGASTVDSASPLMPLNESIAASWPGSKRSTLSHAVTGRSLAPSEIELSAESTTNNLLQASTSTAQQSLEHASEDAAGTGAAKGMLSTAREKGLARMQLLLGSTRPNAALGGRSSIHAAKPEKPEQPDKEGRTIAEGAPTMDMAEEAELTLDDLQQDEWRQTVTHIELRHIGKFTFKGIPQPQAVWQINSKRLSGRSFPAAAASAKAQRAEEGIGLVFCITFEDNEAFLDAEHSNMAELAEQLGSLMTVNESLVRPIVREDETNHVQPGPSG